MDYELLRPEPGECKKCSRGLTRNEKLTTGLCSECEYEARLKTQPLHVGTMGSQDMHEQNLAQDQV